MHTLTAHLFKNQEHITFLLNRRLSNNKNNQ